LIEFDQVKTGGNHLLQGRSGGLEPHRLVFYAFDLLFLDGRTGGGSRYQSGGID
jgi:ATP-dependent DNA ligase